jgi:hypothetical protein
MPPKEGLQAGSAALSYCCWVGRSEAYLPHGCKLVAVDRVHPEPIPCGPATARCQPKNPAKSSAGLCKSDANYQQNQYALPRACTTNRHNAEESGISRCKAVVFPRMRENLPRDRSKWLRGWLVKFSGGNQGVTPRGNGPYSLPQPPAWLASGQRGAGSAVGVVYQFFPVAS